MTIYMAAFVPAGVSLVKGPRRSTSVICRNDGEDKKSSDDKKAKPAKPATVASVESAAKAAKDLNEQKSTAKDTSDVDVTSAVEKEVASEDDGERARAEGKKEVKNSVKSGAKAGAKNVPKNGAKNGRNGVKSGVKTGVKYRVRSEKKKSPTLAVVNELKSAIEAVGKIGDTLGVVQLGRTARTKLTERLEEWEALSDKKESDAKELSTNDKMKSATGVVALQTGEASWDIWKNFMTPTLRKVFGDGSDAGFAATSLGIMLAIFFLPSLIGGPSEMPEAPSATPVVQNRSGTSKPSNTREYANLVKDSFGRRRNLVASVSVEGKLVTVNVDKAYTSLDERTRSSLALAAYDALRDKRVDTVLFSMKSGEPIARVDEATVVYAGEVKLKEDGVRLAASLQDQKIVSQQQRSENAGLFEQKNQLILAQQGTEADFQRNIRLLSARTAAAVEEVEGVRAQVAGLPNRQILVGKLADSDTRRAAARSDLLELSGKLSSTRVAEAAARGSVAEANVGKQEREAKVQKITQSFAAKSEEVLTQARKEANSARVAKLAELAEQVESEKVELQRLQSNYDQLMGAKRGVLAKLQADFDAEMATLREATDREVASIQA